MPFNSTLFLNIIAAIWVLGGLIHAGNACVSNNVKERITSMITAIVLLGIVAVCLFV